MGRGVTIGLDIGSNSVGSAWVDEDNEFIEVGCSVFPAGVEDSDKGRGAPKNQARRERRSARRTISRRSSRKRKLRRFLIGHGMMPKERENSERLMQQDPWILRRDALSRPITPHQFGRVILHLAQRRGATGLRLVDDESTKNADSDGPIKEAIDKTRDLLNQHGCKTFGELVATVAELESKSVMDSAGNPKIDDAGSPVRFKQKVRNAAGAFRFHADREMVRSEFVQIWNAQKAFGGELSELLSDDLKQQLDSPERDETWRHKGLLFQQRNTYWDVGTLGRCDLEPSDRVAPFADYYASRFRVIEYVNNIRIKRPEDDHFDQLTINEHKAVVEKLGSQKTATIKTIRTALGIDTATLRKTNYSVHDYQLNLERDEERPPNTDWFAHAIITALAENDASTILDHPGKFRRLNKAILRFDPAEDADVTRLESNLRNLGLTKQTITAVVAGWRTRPKLEKRGKLSRRAIENLLPYMEQPDKDGRWLTQIEARRKFAEDVSAVDSATGKSPTEEQRSRYRFGKGRLNSAARHYLKKHPDEFLPPPPVLANPVVRKAIYEVRRHIVSYLKRHNGQRPEQVVIEFAREATKPAIVNDRILARNRKREKIRRTIREEIVRPAWGAKFESLSQNQVWQAEMRVLLCLQQRGVCAYSLDKVIDNEDGVCSYSGRSITPRQAALGTGLEVDHIIPYSRCGDKSLNNKVLCTIESNRDKKNQTLREWWGDSFDDRIKPMRSFENAKPPHSEYFDRRDYSKKWKNLSAEKVPKQWKGSQLTDTAYASREVQEYLESALWPNEPSYLEGGRRRIFVTRGSHTAKLRRDWQLYRQADPNELPPSPEQRAKQEAKNRGDHREHALDAVVIALTSESRLQALAKEVRVHNDAWSDARRDGRRPERLKRSPLSPPWGDVRTFRTQVLSLIYPDFAGMSSNDNPPAPLVVCHRPIGRKLSGNLHEESLFGPVPAVANGFRGKKSVNDLSAAHLRLPVPETPAQSIARLTDRYLRKGSSLSKQDARRKAKSIVEGKGFVPLMVDPPPGKSGLIRDIGTRRMLRTRINERLATLGISRDADSFTAGDLRKMLTDDFGPFTHYSGVPIKSVSLLRTMKEPVVLPRRVFNYETLTWEVLKHDKAHRAHVSGNNHHLEIRENARGRWSGAVVSMHEASRRAKKLHVDPVDRSSDAVRGQFMMSLAIGEIVYMREKGVDGEPGDAGYFVVVKIDGRKGRETAEFCSHWDARRAVGEKDNDNQLIANTKRRAFPISPSQMQDLAPPGHATPVKVMVTPLSDVHVVEPHEPLDLSLQEIDPAVIEIAREGLSARRSRDPSEKSRHRRHGSWSWMRAKLEKAGKKHLASQLSAATRMLKVEPEGK